MKRKKTWWIRTNHDIKHNYARCTYAFIRNKYAKTLNAVMLIDPEKQDAEREKRSFTTIPSEMHKEFVEKWNEVFNVHDKVDQPAMVRAYMEKYGRHIPYVKCKFPPLQGHEIMNSIKEMKTSAGGLDGWDLSELKGLPIQV